MLQQTKRLIRFEFLYYIKMIDKKRGVEWEERFKKYWEKEKHKKQKIKENNL